jgi:hypothetical protein
MAQLTGPDNCAECGAETPLETVFNGDSGPLVIPVNDDLVEIPGLYVCTNCAGAIMVGEKEATVTPERALGFLTDTYLPRLAEHMTIHQNEMVLAYRRARDCINAAGKLDPDIEIALAEFELDD